MQEENLTKKLIGFTFFDDYLSNCEELSRKEQDQMIVAITRYVLRGEQPTFKKKYLQSIFNCIKFSLDKSKNASHHRENTDTSEKHKNRLQTEMKSNVNQNEIKQQSNDNQNETETKSNQNQITMNKNKNKNIEREKEKERSLARYSSLIDIGESEITQVAKDYQINPAFVRNCLDDLRNYCDSKGKRYKNYLAALRNFVKSDLNKGAKNASQLATPGLFRKPQDNPDLARQTEILPPKRPMSEAEIQKLRDAMPEIIRQKILAREKAQKEGANNAR